MNLYIVTCALPYMVNHLRVMYLLGYIPGDNRLYLGDKELNIVSYNLQLSVLEYQTAVMRKDFDTADQVLPTIPREMRTRVAHFLEKQVGIELATLGNYRVTKIHIGMYVSR